MFEYDATFLLVHDICAAFQILFCNIAYYWTAQIVVDFGRGPQAAEVSQQHVNHCQ